MHRSMLARALMVAAITAVPTVYANAQELKGTFSGFNELGALGTETGAILSNGGGTLTLKLNKQLQSIAFTLSYNDLGSPVTQAHIHFGKVHVAGGIIVFLCSNLANPPPGTQPCPANGGTVTGTLTPASVIGPIPQNLTPGNFDGFIRALESETAYGNIHTTQFPAGEIRAEIRRGLGPDQP